MNRTTAIGVGCLIFLAATSGADEKSLSKSPTRQVRMEKCQIKLIQQVTLASDRTGILKRIEYKEGDSVANGKRVALIADEVAVATLAVAEKKATNEVEIEFAKVAKAAAEVEHDRLKDANERAARRDQETGRKPEESSARSVSLLEIDKAKLAADKAGLQIQQAEHELAVNKLDRDVKAAELKTYQVLAEFDGTVTRVFKKRGEAVRQGDPIAEVVNTDRVRVQGRIKLEDLRFAKQGGRVRVRLSVEGLDLPEEKEVFEGKITFVDLTSDPILKTTHVYAEVENRNNILRAGLDADMEIVIDETNEATRTSLNAQDSKRPATSSVDR